jgi:hypothetical protein
MSVAVQAFFVSYVQATPLMPDVTGSTNALSIIAAVDVAGCALMLKYSTAMASTNV